MNEAKLTINGVTYTHEEISAHYQAIDNKRFDATALELDAAGKPFDAVDVLIAMYRKLDPSEVVALFKTNKGDWVYGTAGQFLEATQTAAAGKK
jgi:hypothetical protein